MFNVLMDDFICNKVKSIEDFKKDFGFQLLDIRGIRCFGGTTDNHCLNSLVIALN